MGEYAEAELQRQMRRMGVYEEPTGRPRASQHVRLTRMRAHEAFDRIWRSGRMSRGQAYRWLASELGVPEQDAHMGNMYDLSLLQRVVRVSDELMGTPLAADDFPDDLE